MKRILSGILAFLLVLSLVPATPLIAKAAASHSGTCGDNLTWIIDSEGTLTISGTGAIPDFATSSNPSGAPWYSLRNSIKKVVITPECVDGAMPKIVRDKSNPRRPLK